jgi:hypothetical protein
MGGQLTFEQANEVAKLTADLTANFVSAFIDGVKDVPRRADAIVAALRIKYSGEILAAYGLAQAGQPHTRAAAQLYADELSKLLAALSEEGKSAAQLIASHDRIMARNLAQIAPLISPAWDTFKICEAVWSGESDKAVEAGISLGFGMLGAAGGAIIGGLLAGIFTGGAAAPAGAYWGAGIGSAGLAYFAEAFNRYYGLNGGVYPVVGKIAEAIPDSFWRYLNSVAYGAGSASIDPVGSGQLSLLVGTLDSSLSGANRVRSCLLRVNTKRLVVGRTSLSLRRDSCRDFF